MSRKLLILALALVVGATLPIRAQQPASQQAIERAISLYDMGHWIEARVELQALRESLSSVKERMLIEQIDYYMAMCDSKLKMRGAQERMRRYVAEYNGSHRVNDVLFAMGTHYCVEGDMAKAEEEFKRVDYRTLTPTQRDQYDLRMGYIAFMRNDYDDAERYLARIVSKSDYADHATYYRSYMAYTRGEYDVARNGFSSLQQSALYRDLMPYYIMQIDFRSGDYRAVVNRGDALIENTTAEQALQIRRMMAESWFQLEDYTSTVNYINAYRSAGGEMGRLENYILGYSLHRQTLYEDAIGPLREVCGADDMLTQNASYHLADCYLRTGDKTNAMHSFAMASTATYDTAIAEDALFNYGKLQYELGGGRFNETINVLTRYIESYPQSPRRDEAHKLLIAAYYNSHNYGEAYEAIKSLPSPDGDALLALQKIAYFNGLEAYSQGRLEDAERSLGESMSVSSNAKYSALASFWLGEIAYAKGNSGVALQRYRNFVARAPKSGEEYAMAHYNMGYCYFNEKNMPQAGESFDKFLGARARRDDYRADALNRRGDVHYASREFDDAVACYDQAININSTHRYYAEYQRAITMGVQNRRQQKIEALKRIVRSNRGDYVDAASYELGRTYIAEEQYRDAVKALESFVEEFPSSHYRLQALSDLGLAYTNLGERDKALRYYDMVVQAEPQSAQSKGALQGIREIYVEKGDADAYFDYAERMGLEGNVSQMTRDSLSYAAAQKLYLDNRIAEATTSLRSYLNNYPKGYYRNDALFFLSDCYVREGKDEQAIATLTELAEQGTTQYSERVLDKLSRMCYEAERYEKAAKAYRALYDVTTTASVKSTAASGYVASTLKYGDDAELIAMADDAERMTGLTDVALRKARYAKASVLMRQQREEEAMKIFEVLQREVKSAEGAEARYRMIEAQYNAKNYDKAENMVYEFSDSKTPQNYWLAKAFILLGDIYLTRGDEFQARATYQSVVDGYSLANDGIVETAKSKIAKMN